MPPAHWQKLDDRFAGFHAGGGTKPLGIINFFSREVITEL
jgi:hypothetical protein